MLLPNFCQWYISFFFSKTIFILHCSNKRVLTTSHMCVCVRACCMVCLSWPVLCVAADQKVIDLEISFSFFLFWLFHFHLFCECESACLSSASTKLPKLLSCVWFFLFIIFIVTWFFFCTYLNKCSCYTNYIKNKRKKLKLKYPQKLSFVPKNFLRGLVIS